MKTGLKFAILISAAIVMFMADMPRQPSQPVDRKTRDRGAEHDHKPRIAREGVESSERDIGELGNRLRESEAPSQANELGEIPVTEKDFGE